MCRLDRASGSDGGFANRAVGRRRCAVRGISRPRLSQPEILAAASGSARALAMSASVASSKGFSPVGSAGAGTDVIPAVLHDKGAVFHLEQIPPVLILTEVALLAVSQSLNVLHVFPCALTSAPPTNPASHTH